MKRVGVLGGRGHTGRELISLLGEFELAALGTRDDAQVGRTLAESWSAPADDPFPPTLPAQFGDTKFSRVTPDDIATHDVDAWVLGLANGEAAPYIAALQQSGAVVIDLSADHRCDDQWAYGLPELARAQGKFDDLRKARRIANPGCYATALQLAVAPYLTRLAATPHGFGVSGYSGAGATPSPRNDRARLAGNLLPYALVGHVHEREASRNLGRPVRLIPHVAPIFRGIAMTVTMTLDQPVRADELKTRAENYYRHEPLVRIVDDAPELRDAAGRDDLTIGGFAVDGVEAVVVATLDNLRKGAAVQALQNLRAATEA